MKTLLIAKIQTKSNYRNFNGLWLQVIEMMNDRVTCRAKIDGKMEKVDFHLSEIIGFVYTNQ